MQREGSSDIEMNDEKSEEARNLKELSLKDIADKIHLYDFSCDLNDPLLRDTKR